MNTLNAARRRINVTLTRSSQGLAAFNYINENNIHGYIVNIHQGVRDALRQFDQIYNNLYPANPVNLADLWIEFINLWAQRIVNNHRTYITRRLNQLAAPWLPLLNNPQTPQLQRSVAQNAINLINNLRAQIPTQVRFNRNGLT